MEQCSSSKKYVIKQTTCTHIKDTCGIFPHVSFLYLRRI
nr:MAG TPA: hypothetical protein [Caudoviricetes sp.]